MRKLQRILTPPDRWKWPLFILACLLSGLAVSLLMRLIDTQSISQTIASLRLGNLWFTALFLGLITAFFGFLTHSLFFGTLITAVPCTILILVNYFKVLITSTPLSLGDFSLIGQLGEITSLNTESIRFSGKTILALAGLVIWLLITFLFSRPFRLRWKWSLIGSACSALAFFLIFWVFSNTLVFTPLGVEVNYSLSQAATNDSCGPIVGLWRSLYRQITVVQNLGDNYTEEYMLDLVDQIEIPEAEDQTGEEARQAPNIILILSESFFDPTGLPGVTYDEDPVADFHALQSEGVSGTFYTRSLGYGTCNIELEVLTGMNSGLMSGEDLYSWDPTTFSKLPSVISLLNDAGYTTSMIHMFNDSIYHRTGIFNQLGFDHLYFSDSLIEFYPPAMEAEDYWAYMNSRIAGSYYSDDLMTDALIALYEEQTASSDGPVFLYGISMENHSLYTDKYSEEELTVSLQSGLTGEAEENLVNLSQGLHDASAALGKLADYFRTCEEPTVIIFYGDHRPGLGLSDGSTVYSSLGMVSSSRSEWTLEQLVELYSTDYVIWSNDPSYLPGDPGSTEDTSCNYLGSTILDVAGVEKPLYWQLISQLSEVRLCDTIEYHLGQDGVLSSALPEEDPDSQLLSDLREILNDTVYGKGYALERLSE